MGFSLKSQNQPLLLLVVVGHYAIYSYFSSGSFSLASWGDIALQPTVYAPFGGVVVISIALLNSVFTNKFKESIVFFRLSDRLPGHRAFTVHAYNDPRVSCESLRGKVGEFPEDPGEQNSIWYSLYKKVKEDTSVKDANKSYLFFRDGACLVISIGVLLVAWGVYSGIGGMEISLYGLATIVAWQLFALAARNNAEKLVKNVLAQF